MKFRYETYCGGRLLKVFEQVDVPDFAGDPFPTAEAAEEAQASLRSSGYEVATVDGRHFWKIDEQRVAEDVALAMLAKYGEPASAAQ